MNGTALPELARAVFDEAGDAMFLLDLGSEQILEANPAALRLMEWSGAAPRRLGDLLQGDGLDQLKAALHRGERADVPEGLALRRPAGDLPVAVSARPLPGDAGRALLVVRDPDAERRRRAEQALAESRQRFEAFMDHIPLLLFVRDAQGRLVYMNQAYARRMNRSPEQSLGQDEFATYPAEVAQALRRNSDLVLAGGVPVELREHVPTPDGRLREWWVLKFPFRDAQGRTLLGGIALDLTERQQLEQALRVSEERYRLLFERNFAGVWRSRLDGQFLDGNESFLRILGLASRDEARRHTAREFYADPRDRDAILDALHRGGLLTNHEVRLRRVDGTYIWVLGNVSLVQEPTGEAVLEGTIIDITERKQLEEQLRHVQKMEAVGQLAGGMAHDFNNLLTAILANLSAGLAEPPTAEAHRAYLASAEQATLRAAELTRTLLSFARRTPLQTGPVPLRAVIDETLRLARPVLGQNITVAVELPDDLWPIEADPGQVSQVLMNLILNARDAMPQGGRLTLQATNFTPVPDYLRGYVEARPGEYVRLRVADTGQGMPPEVRQRIFEPFFTTKPKGQGTGLGLAMVFSIVKQHNGWLECRSEPGRGTTFDLFWPRARPKQPAPAPRRATGAAGTRGGETILVVDDNDAVRRAAKQILAEAGYQVLAATDGDQALETFRLLHGRIALVVLDSAMPRRSGRETLEALTRVDPQVRVLFSTGFCTEQDAVRAFPQVSGYLPKPYRADELLQKVREVLDAAHPAP